MGILGSGLGLAIFFAVFIVFKWINILNEYERGVIFRLGRVLKEPKGPGFVFVFWPIDRMVKMSLRTVVHDIPPQDVITRDNVSVKVNAVVYFRVMNPIKAVVDVENYIYATSQLAQTTLRAVLGEVDLDDLLSKREEVNVRLQEIIDQHSDPWGVKVSMVEVKHVDLPPDMQRAIAKQAEAEREKRAKIIHASGEFDGRLEHLLLVGQAVVLDFAGMEYMNSGGIGLLVTLLVRAQRSGVRLLATGLSDHYHEILSLTRLDEAIAIHADEAAAVAAAEG